MKLYVGITDRNWYELLSKQPDNDEVNFWQPSGNRHFRAINPGDLFLFKLHSPIDQVVGFGIYSYFSILPVDKAWEYFAEKNGVSSYQEMRGRIEKYRKMQPKPFENYNIGCVMIKKPIFLEKERWFSIPNWSASIVQGKTYDLGTPDGKDILARLNVPFKARELPEQRYGEPITILPRLGQGIFRSMVLDTYNRKCAVTGEKILPILHSAHIKPYKDGGDHSINNGILLREDIHTLFDRGYVTINTDYRLEVSARIKTEFNNGKYYYAMHGTNILLPNTSKSYPQKEILAWHNENIFRAR